MLRATPLNSKKYAHAVLPDSALIKANSKIMKAAVNTQMTIFANVSSFLSCKIFSAAIVLLECVIGAAMSFTLGCGM